MSVALTVNTLNRARLEKRFASAGQILYDYAPDGFTVVTFFGPSGIVVALVCALMGASTYDKLQDLTAGRQWNAAAKALRESAPPVAADLLMGLPFEQQRSLFAHLPIDLAARLLPHFPYYHAYVLLHLRPRNEMRAIVDAMDETMRSRFLDDLPEETWQYLMKELSEPHSAELAVALDEPASAAEAPSVAPSVEVVAPPKIAPPIIQARGVEKSFRQPEGRIIQVIAPIDLSLEAGTFTALLGPSGCGKSTLLRMLSGLAEPSAGQVLWHGAPMNKSTPNVAIVFQSFALFPWLTVVENVEGPLLARGVSHEERHSRALRALETVGLKGFENAYPKELSGGMKQRVGFARALAVEPEILFMDEPFSALDVLTADNLRGELMDLWRSKSIPTRAIFLVTHNIEEAVLLADRILVLGRNPAQIRADFRVPLPQPRDRKSAEFLPYVDYIYKVLTQPQVDFAPPSGQAKPAMQRLPHARPGGITGLLELLLDRGGEEDLYHVANDLSLELDDLLPIIEASELLGFAKAREGDVTITPAGKEFAEADVATQKRLFREAALAHIALIQQIRAALDKKSDHSIPIDFFHDLLDEHFSESETLQQLETALNWGRYGEIFTYDPEAERLRLHEARGHRHPASGRPPRS